VTGGLTPPGKIHFTNAQEKNNFQHFLKTKGEECRKVTEKGNISIKNQSAWIPSLSSYLSF
jgi:hypothetical protein